MYRNSEGTLKLTDRERALSVTEQAKILRATLDGIKASSPVLSARSASESAKAAVKFFATPEGLRQTEAIR